MLFKVITTLLLLLLKEVNSSREQTWIKAGYSYAGTEFPIANLNSALFTHLICGFAHINSSTFELFIPSLEEEYISTFTNIVRRKNPSITTILSIWAGNASAKDFNFFSMLSQSSTRKSFIQSSIRTARLYGFQGIDLWVTDALPSLHSNMTNMGTLFDEWQASINSEPGNSTRSRLILTMAAAYTPEVDSMSYPVDSIGRNLDWVHVLAYDYHLPSKGNFTAAPAALYDPSSQVNTDYGIKKWISRGLPASKLVLGLPFHGYAWTLVNPRDKTIGAPASGPAISSDGFMNYQYIKLYMRSYGSASVYNATYVVNYFTAGSFWIGFDDVDAIRTKVAYAKKKGLLGYYAWQIHHDDDWELSMAAAQQENKYNQEKRQLVIALPTIAFVTLVLGSMAYYFRRRVLKSKATAISGRGNRSQSPNLEVFSFADVEAATNSFSPEYKLGEGGYGPVYKGKLPNGQMIAVKRLSQHSKQGFEEFTNEVTLTAKLQHVNLVRLLGYCTEIEEKMLIYEYMPNKSLDFYLFDPFRRSQLDWGKRVQILEGIIQGLLYLQEYSRLTIIHRDLKASNILLDAEMNPKISDFGIAKSFQKNEHEASTGRIIGTYGYVPPEYVKKGIYSRKYDVYSFGVLLLQIISGRKTSHLYGPENNLNLLEYAYCLWKEGRGMEYMDPSVDDAFSTCKLMRCLQVALLCVGEEWEQRPSMLVVSSMLKNEYDVLPNPEKPSFSTKKDDLKQNNLPLEDICSVDVATISKLVPR